MNEKLKRCIEELAKIDKRFGAFLDRKDAETKEYKGCEIRVTEGRGGKIYSVYKSEKFVGSRLDMRATKAAIDKMVTNNDDSLRNY